MFSLFLQLDVIGIDEAQFLTDLCSFCQTAADYEGKTLIIAGLDGDFLRSPPPSLSLSLSLSFLTCLACNVICEDYGDLLGGRT